MPARAAWKGFLKINQLSVPVKAFTAGRSEPEISLNQLHRGCGQRVRQQKVCPVHGVIGTDEIVSGFEHSRDQYLVLEDDELAALDPDDNKLIEVDCFVAFDGIDPVYHAGRTYYLVPEAPPGQRSFCVFRDGMRSANRHGVARVVMGRRELLVLLRPMGRLVAMTVLEYAQRVRPAVDYEGEVASIKPGEAELSLMGDLINALTDQEFAIDRYRDLGVERLNDLIERTLAEQGTSAASTTADEVDEAMLVQALRGAVVHARGA